MYTITEVKKHKDNVLKLIAQGKSINEIEMQNGIPSNDTIYKWLNIDAQFKDNYIRARQDQALFYAEKVGYVIKELKDDKKPSREKTDIARLEIDSLKWIASKLLPKVYGSNQHQTNIQVNIQPVTGMQIVDEPIIIEESNDKG